MLVTLTVELRFLRDGKKALSRIYKKPEINVRQIRRDNGHSQTASGWKCSLTLLEFCSGVYQLLLANLPVGNVSFDEARDGHKEQHQDVDGCEDLVDGR